MERSERGSLLFVHTIDKRIRNEVENTREENSGFILLKDKKAVVFYTKYIADTPYQDVEGIFDYILKFLHGLSPLKIWIGTEYMNRATFEVPCCIVAYSIFMNFVYRFDEFI